MARAQISGFTVLTGSRILVPSQIATIEPGVELPVVGTIEVAIEMATVGTIVAGAITASIEGGVTDLTKYVGTVDSVGTIKSGVINKVEAIDLIGSISEGKVTASISGGILNQVGSIVTSGTIPISIDDYKKNIPVLPTSYYSTPHTDETLTGAAGTVSGLSGSIDLTGIDYSSIAALLNIKGPFTGSIKFTFSEIEPQTKAEVGSLAESSWIDSPTTLSLAIDPFRSREARLGWYVANGTLTGTVAGVYTTIIGK